MKRYFEFLWQLSLTPFYYIFLGATSTVVLFAFGPKEFKKFWSKNK